MPRPPPRADPLPRDPRDPRPGKSVSFCRCTSPEAPARDLRYYSDPYPPYPANTASQNDLKYYSEPDNNDYFEIDYVFLKQLRDIAKKHCPKCKRKRAKNNEGRTKTRRKDTFVYCHGKYHRDREHCRLCCRTCTRSTDTLDSVNDDDFGCRSYSKHSKPRAIRERKDSIQSSKSVSNKSVSFLESSNDVSLKDETNYTAKSFTNDLKKFLLKPSPPRLSLRDKFVSSFKQELEATRRSPKLKAIKGLWKSY